jgi:hypothetical protein
MFVPDRTRREVVVEQKGSVEVQSFAGNARSMHKMQMALGRTREGKRSSSWCWLQLFSAARLVGLLTPLPAFCCAGWLTRPSGHCYHWAAAGALASTGIPRAKQARKGEQGLACRRGRCLWPLSTLASQSILPTVVRSRRARDEGGMICQFQLQLQRRPFREILCDLLVRGTWIAGSPIALREPGHPKTHNLAAVLGGAGRSDPPPLLATRPACFYPDRVNFPLYTGAR